MRRGPRFLWVLLLLFIQFYSYAEAPGPHRGAIHSLLSIDQGLLISAGEDGFINMWNQSQALERFQLSPWALHSMGLRPGRTQIAVIESMGIGRSRVSAWDYQSKERIFQTEFLDQITYLNYSAGGSYIILSGNGLGGTQTFIIHADTGALLSSLDLSSLSLAITGRTERVMVAYQTSGLLSYWDLSTGMEVERVQVPARLESPVLFGNNRFLGGFDSRGLLILDAVTGQELGRLEAIPRGILLSPGEELYCLELGAAGAILHRLELSPPRPLRIIESRPLPDLGDLQKIAGAEGSFYLANTRGEIYYLSDETEEPARLWHSEPRILREALPSSWAIGILTQEGLWGHIPLDYRELMNGDVLLLESALSYTHGAADTEIWDEPAFLAWQGGGIQRAGPLIIRPGGLLPLGGLSLRYSYLTGDLWAGRALVLDSFGLLSILDSQSGALLFNYTSSSAMDALFIDEDTVLLGRNAAGGQSPFLSVNVLTGETVSLFLDALLGHRVYRGPGGTIYGGLITQGEQGFSSAIYSLNLRDPSLSEILVYYRGEDTDYALAESGGNLATNLGDHRVGVYLPLRGAGRDPAFFLQRTEGLPYKISNGQDRWFILLDREGIISWHDSSTGELLAVFRLYEDYWTLERRGLYPGLKGPLRAPS
ncbi:MAG: hypothetical protein FWH12_02650 [Treponema sp.]|nr:hypothetical protein [Treponema sp.]